ncbi:MAG TPA: S8 family serine peptidase [Thermoanaerobaculia bacterium]|nr:S8 family serine peptidase [Thermoanaerobaculia bacterium]
MRQRWSVLLIVAATIAFGLGGEDAPKKWSAPVGASLQKQQRQPEEPRGATVDLIVRFRQPAGGLTTNAIALRRDAIDGRVAGLRRELERLEVRPEIKRTFHRVLFGASVRVPRELRSAIASLPSVASVHEDRRFQALLANSVPQIHAPQAWAQTGTRGAGVTVAIIDTGIDYNHPALGGAIGSGFKVTGGWDFYDGDPDPMDESGHGTHVAGIVAGNGGGIVGVAPDASLIAYRVLGPNGGAESDVIAAIERSVDPNEDGDPSDHVDVVNMSLGGAASEDDPAAAAVESATAAGVLFCIAAGNYGDYGNLNTPGIAPSAITVGASDRHDDVADFSSRGPNFDFGIKPEIVAPGVGIVSAIPDGKTIAADGTSMAAPHVAGVAALVKAVHPEWSPAEIKAAVVTSAVPVDEEVMIGGAGRVDALQATTLSTLVSPATVSFGQANVLPGVWTASRTVTLRNVSSAPQTLMASIQGLRNGVTVSVTPPVVDLAPGASATVTVDLAVTTAAVPAPAEGSLSFGGRIEWRGGGVPVRVPWAFVKGAFLTIHVPDGENYMLAEVLGGRWKAQTDFFYVSARVFWPLEKVDVVVRETGSVSRGTVDRIVVAEQVDTFASPRVTMPLSAARFKLTASTTDETGAALESEGRECVEHFVFAFPQGRKYSVEQSPSFRPLYGPMSDRIKAYLLHACADVAHETLYGAIHEPWQGIHADVTSTSHPEWLRQDVRFVGATEEHLTGALATLRFPGPVESYYFAGGWWFLMRPTSPSLRVLYARSPVPEVELMATLERMSRCYSPDLGHDVDCSMYSNAFVYFDDQGVRVDSDLFFDVSPMAYRVPAGKTLAIGGGPFWAQQGFSAGPGFWLAGAGWMGAAGERREVDSVRAHTILRDEAGAVIAENPAGYVYGYETLPRTAYTVQSINSYAVVGGIAGTATLTSVIDLRKPDPLFPWLTGMRIEDAGGLQANVFERGASATLAFSVADLLQEGQRVRRVPPREEATRVEYRRRGTSTWKPLTPLVHARDYQSGNGLNGGTGTMYRVDLSAVTREIHGGVDVRIYAEDAGGNSVELLIEPALFVGDPSKSRAVRR